MSKEKVTEEIGNCIRGNVPWDLLPVHLRSVLHNNQRDYEKYVFNFSLKNQLRFRGNLVSKIFRHEQRYYEQLVQRNINGLACFPYHLADIVTKGLRVTPFNYYLEVLSQLLRSDKSYDTLPNFTAADCLRVLGIGRNEYLSLISNLKTNTTRTLIFSAKPNPLEFLPRFPVHIRIDPWWRIDIGFVLETDIRYLTAAERSLLDDLIDFGAQLAGKCDYKIVHSLYRKGLIYLDVPICSEDRISIPPLRNFVMNRISGDYFENLLYKIFVSADEHMTINELAHMLQVEIDAVKQAVSFFCRLGFAQRKDGELSELAKQQSYHASWEAYNPNEFPQTPQITPLNYNSFLAKNLTELQQKQSSSKETKVQTTDKDNSSIGYLSSDGNASDLSYVNISTPSPATATNNSSNSEEFSSELEEITERPAKTNDQVTLSLTPQTPPTECKSRKRIGFLFDSTLTAFLMMGNLSPGLKNHAVTMFEVGKLCDESMDSFLAELEKVSLLDAEGEGDVSRYFAHAVILRSTICSLRHLLPGGLDLLRLECLECLDKKTRDRVLEKKYKFIISATPLTANLSHTFTVPFFGQFYPNCHAAHMWTKMFYNHISGYGPPSLFLRRGTVLKTLPRLFLGYGKLLVNILHSDSYVISSENFLNLNEQLKNGCVLIQCYGIRQPGELRYESFPFNLKDARHSKWAQHKAVKKLSEHLDLTQNCGYITFLSTGVPDLGCEDYELQVKLKIPQNKKSNAVNSAKTTKVPNPTCIVNSQDANTSGDSSDITSFALSSPNKLKTLDENHFASMSTKESPENFFTSADCTELLASEVAKCSNKIKDEGLDHSNDKQELVSQSSVEVPMSNDGPKSAEASATINATEEWTLLDVNFGVPLFDVDCNTRICEQLVKWLHRDENLNNLSESANRMQTLFYNFVQQCLHYDEKGNAEPITIGKSLPYPRINLAFENGHICYWNGR